MQTDKEKLIELLTNFEIPFTENCTEVLNNIIITDDFESSNVKLEGYYGFYVKFDFDEEGKFIKIGIWE